MDEWMDRQVGAWIGKQTLIWLAYWAADLQWMEGEVDVMDGWMGGWIDGSMEGLRPSRQTAPEQLAPVYCYKTVRILN